MSGIQEIKHSVERDQCADPDIPKPMEWDRSDRCDRERQRPTITRDDGSRERFAKGRLQADAAALTADRG